MNNVVFAANKSHAKAMIGWLKLDGDLWHPNAYGDKLKDQYDRAILVRPVDGITQEHFLWVTIMLVPRMRSVDNITPLHWSYAETASATVYDQLTHAPDGTNPF